jgi:hypothetical protein
MLPGSLAALAAVVSTGLQARHVVAAACMSMHSHAWAKVRLTSFKCACCGVDALAAAQHSYNVRFKLGAGAWMN